MRYSCGTCTPTYSGLVGKKGICYMAVLQNSLSGIWPTLARKCNPFASSFAKLSRSLFSNMGHLGVSIYIPTFEGLHRGFRPSHGSFRKSGAGGL